jgi:hypothetical protein
MDVQTVIAAILSSGVVSVAAVRWFGARLVDHQLARDLKRYEAALAGQAAVSKGEIDERLSAATASLEAHSGLTAGWSGPAMPTAQPAR